jgi:hypothetical protein
MFLFCSHEVKVGPDRSGCITFDQPNELALASADRFEAQNIEAYVDALSAK